MERGPNGTQHELTVRPDAELMTVPFDADRAVEAATQIITARRRILSLALKELLKPQDIVDFGGKPYIQSTGCERFIMAFGLSVTDIEGPVKHEEQDSSGKYYIITYTATFTMRQTGASIRVAGNRSSRDKFFAQVSIPWAQYANKSDDYTLVKQDGEKAIVLKQEIQVPESHIRTAAYSNMMENGVTRLLGLRGLTWAEFEALGFNRSQAGGKVEFKGKSGGSQQPQTQSQGGGTSQPKTATAAGASSGGKHTPEEMKLRDEFIANIQKLYAQMGWDDGWRKNAFSKLVTTHYGQLTTLSTEHLGQIYDALAKVADGSKPVKFEGERTKDGNFHCVWVEEPAAEADPGADPGAAA